MTLIEVVENLESLGDENTIYAEEPWADHSKVMVIPEPAEGGIPMEAEKIGLKYFLEIFVAREVLKGWASNLDTKPTLQEQCARLIRYAITDA